MATLVQDLRYALRGLLRNRTFTLMAVIAMALGIGANTAIFSLVNTALLRELPYPHPERLVTLWERNLSSSERRNPTSPANFLAWQDVARSFDAMAAFVETRVTVSGVGDEPVAVQARLANASLLPMLGARPVLGRLFTAQEDLPGAPGVAVLSYGLWTERFGGRPGAIGQAFTLNGRSYSVVGVLPRDFRFREPVDLWTPIRFTAQDRSWFGRYLRVVARLKPGVTPEQADLEMQAIARQRAQDVREFNSNWTASAVPLRESLVSDVRPALLALFGAVGLLLMIACANVANLLLARAADRQREIAVRISLGASPGRIVRQLLTESVLLAFVASAAGLLLALWGTSALLALIPKDLPVPAIADVTVDWRVLAFTGALAVLTGVAFGLAPALHAVRNDVHEALQQGGRSGLAATRASGRMHGALVVVEVSLALILLAGAGLMVRSFAELRRVRLGFEPHNVLTAEVALPHAKYGSDTAQVAFFREAEARIAALPGVKDVGAISYLPLSGERSASAFTVEGQPTPPPGQEPSGDMRAVTPGYFHAMGIPIKAGRALNELDGKESPEVAVVSETLARTFWPTESAVGHYLLYEWDGNHRVQIVGVAGDVHHGGPSAEPFMEIYRPLTQFPYAQMTLVVRTAVPPMSLTRPVREAIRSIDRDQPVAQLRTMDALVSDSFGKTRLSTALFGLFGLLGAVLATVGIFGVMSYAVLQRRHEIGVRIALGAQPRDVLAMIVGRGAYLTGLGIAVGLVGALVLTRLMRTLLFGVAPGDPATLGWMVLILAAVALLASYVPAYRATRIDPLLALRNE